MDKTIHIVRRQSQGRVTYGPAFTTRALLDLHFPNVEALAVPVLGTKNADLAGCKKLFAHVTPGERAQQLLGVFISLAALHADAGRTGALGTPAVVEIRLEA
jgi:hypothetical protein